MKETFEAVWSRGALRPLRRTAGRDGQRVRVSIEPEGEDGDAPGRTYDFSDLAGKLTWEGDALEEQERMRDEWR
jgi:predicted DNA-binding antitoxin AbrB/MazE fold protein